MKAVKLENFPVGNPFHHDYISVGANLGDVLSERLKGYYIMSSGMNPAYDLYLVNSKTGERIGVKL